MLLAKGSILGQPAGKVLAAHDHASAGPLQVEGSEGEMRRSLESCEWTLVIQFALARLGAWHIRFALVHRPIAGWTFILGKRKDRLGRQEIIHNIGKRYFEMREPIVAFPHCSVR